MKHQKGYINIPGWFFWMVPIGFVLLIVEFVRLCVWIYENVEVTIK